MINVGIVGCGYWGPNLIRNFSDVDGARVAAVCDLSQDRLSTISRRMPTVETTTDYWELVRNPKIDAVVVATPVSSHYPIALAALQNGKHVLVEKPMTETSEQAERLINEAARRNVTLMVDHTFIYTPAIRKIKQLITDGEIGHVHYYDSLRINLGLFQRDVNVIWDLAVHDLTIIDHLLGESVTALSASGASHVSGSPESMATLTLFFDQGTIAHVNVNWLAPVKVRQLHIGGSKKMIVYDDLQISEKVKVYDKGVIVAEDTDQLHQLLIGYRSGDMWAPQLPAQEALRIEAQHFIDCIETRRAPITDGFTGLRIVRLLEAASWSMAQRGQPIDLQLTRIAS
ncbi:Gfo/Idh/MocA family oxidoreductase [Azospirillum sp. A1-3]|uniref:Gfo/Idh/MocA family protein n=1 Tax=Azospirillum sp. A1-3 TaxID=185874 RepID=UPI002076F76B|nr:Gfo/Idh/MocA family oxidoreductase [Azospirillum sp. A1-3]MCM8738597.1 Gfo/Idh/MocA family oxidoreductase [Azospirillum sp. A1-3]